MKNRCSIIAWCAFFLLTAVPNALAQEKISAEELLQILMEKGIITEQDIENAKKTPKEKARVCEEKEEVTVKAARQPKAVNFKGRVQARFTSIENGDLSMVTSQNAFDQSEFDGFVLRRVRLRWFGEVTDQWKYHVHVSVDGDHNDDKLDPALPDYELRRQDVGVKLQDAYFVYELHPYFNIRVGQFKSRFSPSYTTAGPALPLCERPLVVDQITRKREIGISLESPRTGQWDGRAHGEKIHDRPLYYALGLYNGNGFNHMRNDNENFMVLGMLLYRPSPHVNFGISYAYDQVGYDYETTVLGEAERAGEYYRFPVEDHAVADNLQLWDFSAALELNRLHLQAECIVQDGDASKRQYGYGIQGEFDLTDTIQVTARYEEFDPNVDVDNTFDSRWYTLGCNWFLQGQRLKWQSNYTFREEVHGEDVDNDTLITHFQVLF